MRDRELMALRPFHLPFVGMLTGRTKRRAIKRQTREDDGIV